MKHVIVGGDGFVGRYLAEELLVRGEEVVVCDVNKSDLEIYRRVSFIELDITDRSAFKTMPLDRDDIVYNLAARMLDPILPRWKRREYFWIVNHTGTEHLLEFLLERECGKLIYFTTDMVYGHMKKTPQDESHPKEPLGPYGESKNVSEDLCASYRERGMNITIFRPRLIIGPGRLGVLKKLFWLIEHNLPVPLIGDGSNHYQFISVFDCVSAALLACDNGVPNEEYNLGSKDPPTVEELLRLLIKAAGKMSPLLKTPAGLVKQILGALDFVGLPLMDPEQYLIADEDCVLDISKAETELGWHPRFRDEDMLCQAYREYKSGKLAAGTVPS
ncbi:MAG: NAD-dependent epimerase/dehydratase family protein [Acidiferrobacterales bacterium]